MKDIKDTVLLIVDDEILLRDATATDFRRKGFQVLVAANGREALEVMKTQVIDLVLTDVQMPNGDGVEFLKEVNTLGPQTPMVILISGFSDMTIEEAYTRGASAVFPKPYYRKELLAAVLTALSIDVS